MPIKNWLAACLFILLPAALSAQNKPIPMVPVYDNESVQPGNTVIYGNFIQRLGFSSGGFSQDIYLRNRATGKTYAMRVKATYKSKKENTFCFHLPAGEYELSYYQWTQSKWYGGMAHLEPISKNINFDEARKLVKEGKLTEDQLQRYTFTAEPGKLQYLGTWHFDTPTVSFSDDKQALDEKTVKYYKKLDFASALTTLPQ